MPLNTINRGIDQDIRSIPSSITFALLFHIFSIELVRMLRKLGKSSFGEARDELMC